MAFSGFPASATEFYEGLAADNSKQYWQANKSTYDEAVKAPMEALLAELAGYGPFHIFRPNRDVRFAKDKRPYKENIGAIGESQAGASYYVQLDADGMFAGGGYYHLQADQLDRYRAAVADPSTGADLEQRIVAALAHGLELATHEMLKTAPRGYPRDHPRIDLLRRKGLATIRRMPAGRWMHTRQVVDRVREAWDGGAAVSDWMNVNVGPSTLPPDEQGW